MPSSARATPSLVRSSSGCAPHPERARSTCQQRALRCASLRCCLAWRACLARRSSRSLFVLVISSPRRWGCALRVFRSFVRFVYNGYIARAFGGACNISIVYTSYVHRGRPSARTRWTPARRRSGKCGSLQWLATSTAVALPSFRAAGALVAPSLSWRMPVCACVCNVCKYI